MAYTEEELFDMSDEELEKAYKESLAEESSPDTAIEEENIDQPEEESTENANEVDDVDNEDSDMEQPDEESIDAEEGEGEDENKVDDDSDVSADDSDEVQPNTEEQQKSTDEEPAKPEAKAQPEAKKYKFKANGQEFEFTEKEIMNQFGKVFGQAMNYTKKMQAIAPYRSMINTIEEQRLTQEDLNLAIDVLKGDKNAIAAVLKKADVDPLEFTEEVDKDYKPTNYAKGETELAIKDVVSEIGSDPEFQITQHVIDNQWDPKSQEAFLQQPELIKDLHVDIKSGVFDKVSPMAMKLKVLDGGRRSDLEYYLEAGKQYYAEEAAKQQREAELEAQRMAAEKAKQEAERINKAKAEADKRAKEAVRTKKRKAAAPTRSRVTKSAVDYLDESDEAFEEWYKQLQERY